MRRSILAGMSLLLLLTTLAACQTGAEDRSAATPTSPPTPPPATIAATIQPTTQPSATAEPAEPTATPLPPEPEAWWEDRIFYEIFVRSFYDSDGDGVGDINGIIEQLDYLNDGDPNTTDDLGITGIWLMPIHESPSYHGYDVVDYYAIDSEYGTMDDFRRLLEEAEKRDIKIIIDLVLNHTSSRHPWFIEARRGEDSAKRDYYIFAEENPGYNSPWGGRAWHVGGGGYYYGVFWNQMPDLNYENPAVTEEIEAITHFWLNEVGVDGFRLDAIKHLIEDGADQENTEATLEWFSDYYEFYKEVNPNAFTVGEVWSPTFEVVKYVDDRVDAAFEFETAEAILISTIRGNTSFILPAHRNLAENFEDQQVATFLTNHDQNRVMNRMLGDVERAKLAATLLLTGPGTPFIYYGEEIGHSGRKPDEDIRTPMQWSDASFAGFTNGTRVWRPPQPDYTTVNVANQTDDPDSLLSHYRRLVHLRNSSPALNRGEWIEVETQNQKVYAFLRHAADQQTVLVVINLNVDAQTEYALSVPSAPIDSETVSELFNGASVESVTLNGNGGFTDYRPVAELAPRSLLVIEFSR